MKVCHQCGDVGMGLVSCPTRLSSSWWWRPQIAPFENCSIWESLHLRIAPFENCSIWEMLHLRNAPFEKCYIWETWGWRQFIHFEKAAISIKMVYSILSKQWLVQKRAMCLETLKELMIGVQDWDQIKQHRDCESPSDGKGLACQGGWCSLKQLAYQVVTYVAHPLS